MEIKPTNPREWQIWFAAHQATKDESIKVFVQRVESLRQVKGIGDALFTKIINHINEGGFLDGDNNNQTRR